MTRVTIYAYFGWGTVNEPTVPGGFFVRMANGHRGRVDPSPLLP